MLPNPLKNLRLRTKLILSFLAFSSVSLVFSGILAVNSSSQAIREKIGNYSAQLMEQIGVNINTRLLKIKTISDEILIGQDVTNRLLGYRSASATDQLMVRLLYVRNMQLKFLNLGDIDDVLMLFMKDAAGRDWDFIHTSVQYKWPPAELQAIVDHDRAPDNIRNLRLGLLRSSVDGQPEIVMSRKVGNALIAETLGHLIIVINQSYLLDVYRDIDVGLGADIFLIDQAGTVVSSRNPAIAIGQRYLPEEVVADITAPARTSRSPISRRIAGQDCLVAAAALHDLPWYVVSTIPHAYLDAETGKIGQRIVWFTLAILALAVAVALAISRSFSAPLARLERKMAEFGEGRTDVRVEVDRQDEVGHLQESFNAMAQDIRDLLGRIDEEHRLRQLTELRLIEYQINPHFLYNSLDSINWMALRAGQPEISTMVTALARFFRLGLSKGADIYRIRDEIEHVENYLTICRIRYRDCFRHELDVDPAILDCRTVKIILQPLVENALKHGLDKKSDNGLIRISGRANGGRIELTVSDNGAGMTAGQLSELRQRLAGQATDRASPGGFGLANVGLRLRLQYGGDYGLSVDSQEDEGTTVRLTLPRMAADALPDDEKQNMIKNQ